MSENVPSQSVTAYLAINGAAEAIEFYKQAFGATEHYRLPAPGGKVGHAELIIGNSLVYLADEAPELDFLSPTTRGGATAIFAIEVDDADAAFERAVSAGATVDRGLRDEPYGRTGDPRDPFGHRWLVIKVNPDFKPEDMEGA